MKVEQSSWSHSFAPFMCLVKHNMRSSSVIFSRTEVRLTGLHFPRSFFLPFFIDGHNIWPFLVIYGFIWILEYFRNSRWWLLNNEKKPFDASHPVQHTCICGTGREGHHLTTTCGSPFALIALQRLRGWHDLWRIRQRCFIYLGCVTDTSSLPIEIIAMQRITMAVIALGLTK